MITEPCQITTWCGPLAEVEAQESVFGDLRQSWVNPVLLLSEVTHVNIKSHDSNHLLDKCGCLRDRKSTRLNSSHVAISYAVFCLKKKNQQSRQKSTSVNNFSPADLP